MISSGMRPVAPVSDKQQKEREREELVTRFFAYGDGLEEYEDEVSPFLSAYARKMNTAFASAPDLENEYRERFHQMVSFVAKNFPFGFRRSAKGMVSPRARFESISVGSFMALQQNPTLKPDPEHIAEWSKSKEFSNVTGADGANAIKRLTTRINFVKDMLLES